MSCHSSSSSNNNNNRLCMLASWITSTMASSMPPSQLEFPKLVPPPNCTQNKGRKFQVTSQLHLTAQHTAFVCTESRLCVNCSMVRNWKVCQPESIKSTSTCTPLQPPPRDHFSSVPNSSAHVQICTIFELAGTKDPDICLFVCLFVFLNSRNSIELPNFLGLLINCQILYVFLWMIAILAAAREIPPTKRTLLYGIENFTTQ